MAEETQEEVLVEPDDVQYEYIVMPLESNQATSQNSSNLSNL